MKLLFTIVFIGSMICAAFFAYRAREYWRCPVKRRNNNILVVICLMIMLIAIKAST